MFDRSINKYSDAHIAIWSRELSQIPVLQEAQLKIMADQKIRIENIGPQLDHVKGVVDAFDSQINSLNVDIVLLEARNTVDTIDHLQRNDQRRSDIDQIGHVIVDAAVIIELHQLRLQRNRLENQRAPHVAKKDRLQATLNEYQRRYEIAEAEVARLENRTNDLHTIIRDAEFFLSDLQYNPRALCENFINSVNFFVDQHEKQYPAHQSMAVRIALRELPQKMACISNSELYPIAEVKESIHNDVRQWQIRYALLCELLWQQLEIADMLNDINRHFLEKFRNLFYQHVHLESDDDLPDRVRPTGLPISRHYDNLKQTYPLHMQNLTASQIENIEADEYKNAHQQLRQDLGIPSLPNVPAPIYKQVNHIIAEVDNLKNTSCKPNQPKPDVKFYTSTLKQTHTLIQNPSERNIKRYEYLADRANGSVTCGKVLGGAMLALVGVIGFSLSLFIALASFGVTTPASALGIACGTTALVKGLSIIGGAVSAYLTYKGCGLFRRKGQSKQMNKLANEARSNPWQFYRGPSPSTPLLPSNPEPSAPDMSASHYEPPTVPVLS